jgi:hypothetical protein
LKYSCFPGMPSPRFSIVWVHATNSAGGCAFAVCVNYFATVSSDGVALTVAVNQLAVIPANSMSRSSKINSHA